jgi:catechol 2,3-dioxygenase-like lactoylglutathione lyase family enzyme
MVRAALLGATIAIQGCASLASTARPTMMEHRMKPKITVLTLAVGDLQAALAFYRDGLGFATKGIVGTEFEDGAVVFFDVNDGSLILALYPRAALAKDAKVPISASSPSELSIGHFVGSKRAVDTVIARAQRAGATITDPPRDRFWGGYAGYFQDLDGHLWEIGWNPQLDVRD